MRVEIVNKSGHPAPHYATAGSSGVDLRCALKEDLVVPSFHRTMIPTGIFISIPPGYEGQIRSKSGVSWKQGLVVLNSPGTIDSDYRGELKILLINLSLEEQVIKAGERIAQLVISPVQQIVWEEVQELSQKTGRGEGGVGSTGTD